MFGDIQVIMRVEFKVLASLYRAVDRWCAFVKAICRWMHKGPLVCVSASIGENLVSLNNLSSVAIDERCGRKPTKCICLSEPSSKKLGSIIHIIPVFQILRMNSNRLTAAPRI